VIYWLVRPAVECPGIGRTALPPDFLSATERQTYARLTFPKRRREWLLGRWTAKRLLQLSLEAYRLLPSNAITVGNDPDGAPYLSVDGKGRLPLSLSISHRGERAFCAFSPSTVPSIGADLERVDPRDPAFVQDFFTPQEANRVCKCPPSMRDTLITVIWSAKESVLKALRQGLRVDTRRVEIGHVADLGISEAPGTRNLKPGTWHVVQVSCTLPDAGRFLAWWRPDGGDVLTLAVRSS